MNKKLNDLLHMGGFYDETQWGEQVGMVGLMLNLNAVRLNGDSMRDSARRLVQGGDFLIYEEDAEKTLKEWGFTWEGDAFDEFVNIASDVIVCGVLETVGRLRSIEQWEIIGL